MDGSAKVFQPLQARCRLDFPSETILNLWRDSGEISCCPNSYQSGAAESIRERRKRRAIECGGKRMRRLHTLKRAALNSSSNELVEHRFEHFLTAAFQVANLTELERVF